MLLYILTLFDACTFFIWCASFIWFLSVDPTNVAFEDYRTQHTSLLVHAITTWQLMWLLDDHIRTNGKRVRWQPRVRTCIFLFTLILDVFMLVRNVRFTTRVVESAWGIQVAISTLFTTSSFLALCFIGIKNT
jgi:hypothetical protein